MLAIITKQLAIIAASLAQLDENVEKLNHMRRMLIARIRKAMREPIKRQLRARKVHSKRTKRH